MGELIIIHSDRLEHDEADRIQAVTRQQEFDATTDRLTTALNGIQKTLIAANTTLIQTQPHALFGDPRVLLLPGPFVAGQHIDYELTFTNDGNETAQRPYIYSKSYVGKPSDGTVEKQLKAKFEQDWRAAKGPAIRHTDIPSHSPHVGRYPTPTFAQSDIDNINAATDTIYIFSRVDYTDETGHWFSDGCLGIFVPLRKPPDNAGATPCFDRSTVRYHPKHN